VLVHRVGASPGGGKRMGSLKQAEGASAGHALALLQEALAILDDLDFSADIGAHVDLAITRLQQRLAASGEGDTERR